MVKLSRKHDPVQRALRARPYLHRRYYPLAAILCSREYSDPMRDRILDYLGDGGFLESLAVDGTLDPGDLAPALAALEDGRAWERAYRLRASFGDLAPAPEADGGWPDEGPAEDDQDDGMAFPRKANQDDRRAFEAEVIEWFKTHPEKEG
jgi:hypothetical protein